MKQLQVSIGQHSDKGKKPINQDFHGAYIPKEPQLTTKGIAIALADGISSSDVSQIASESAVTGFLDDYYCTSDAWSVHKSAQQVILAMNSWLHAQTKQSRYCYEAKDRGYVCTFSALILKSTTAYLFHVGDTRIYHLHNDSLEQLTQDHRVPVSQGKSYLSRALGIDLHLDIDHQSVPLAENDIFILATDGIYEFVSNAFMTKTIEEHSTDLDKAAEVILNHALTQGSDDNLTIQIVRIDMLPLQDAKEVYQQLTALPFPPELEARTVFDGYEVVRKIHASSRSHVYLVKDVETGEPVIIKTPSIDLRGDAAYLERFLMEEWIARRINNPHVLKPCPQNRAHNYLYVATEFIDGQTLTQWMIDNPNPDMEAVRGIMEQIAKGLQAFHRLEMLHQDLRPENIMIDKTGTVKIIDFGATHVAGILEITNPILQQHVLGTAQYTAPEYFLGEPGTPRSDMYSLAVITYQMLSGRFPYGTEVAKSRTKNAQKKLVYQSVLDDDREIPMWVDEAIRKAVHPDPYQRYDEITEFVFDLRHPNQKFLNKTRPPLIERSPVLFWKSVSLVLALIIVFLLAR
ncbi:bifunctional protein-serine/threonine kinase/phosphatase [Ghiorsea bivora]|uniref:bifunctional protein-serine/threonine kinase/phosphatase n=1 Tax=Ghiorsea bivora TaxID=1485545 RepID=UPI0005719B82|nr:bifunctional protein-serine/threonine kinase/phosphatase [Ghiorsea bivora]